MDRGAWQATVHGAAEVGHDLATKPPPGEFLHLSPHILVLIHVQYKKTRKKIKASKS